MSNKVGSWAIIVVAIASISGELLMGCTRPPQNTATPGETSQPAVSQGMNHNLEMDLGPNDAEFDLRFIDAMILHHQGAIEMAKAAQQLSPRSDLKQLADNIIQAQETEIAQMQQWRKVWYPQASDQPLMYDAKMGHSMEMSAAYQKGMKMEGDLGLADAQFDLRFINSMIPHHEGAVAMAQQVLKNSQRPEMQKLAQAIIADQQKEIQQMQQWRKSWYNQ